jgi:hypothetical protein
VITQRLHSDYTAIAQRSHKIKQRLRSDYAAITQRSHSDFRAIAKRFHSDCAAISQRSRSDCATISQRLRSDYAAITQRLRSNFTSMIAKRLPSDLRRFHSECKSIASLIRSHRKAIVRRFRSVFGSPRSLFTHSLTPLISHFNTTQFLCTLLFRSNRSPPPTPPPPSPPRRSGTGPMNAAREIERERQKTPRTWRRQRHQQRCPRHGAETQTRRGGLGTTSIPRCVFLWFVVCFVFVGRFLSSDARFLLAFCALMLFYIHY